MKKKHYTDVEAGASFPGDACGLEMRSVINAGDGAPNFDMRVLNFETGGQTHFHDHAWEHEIFIIEGEGAVVLEGSEESFKTGDAIFIEGWEKHRIKNTGSKPLRLICCIPQKKS